MRTHSWTVDVDGKEHAVVVDYDAESRRAAIRVDGRLTVKPMSAAENERDLPIGSAQYIVRRLENDVFELDVPPEEFLNRAARGSPSQRAAAAQPKQRTGGIGLWIGLLALPIIVTAFIRYGRQGLEYMRVPWQPYSAPEGAFKAKFPTAPTSQQETQNIDGDLWTVESRYARYKDHFYAVEYVDLKMVVMESSAQSLIDRFLDGWIGGVGGRVTTKEVTSLFRNPAKNFVAMLPAGAGDGEKKLPVDAQMRGVLALRGRRLYVVWTLAAATDPFSKDLREFIESFQIEAPPPPVTFAAVVQQAPEEPPPRPRVVEQSVVVPMDPARIAAETAARRAGQPQIYLEPVLQMYHVAGCRTVTAEMKRVSAEERPFGYAAHLCVPENIRNWRRSLAR